MPHADFVHLRVHSAYSLSEGAIHIKALIKLCRDERMPAVAITDTGNLFGALEFSAEAADNGVQPIIGCLLGTSFDESSDPQKGRRARVEPLVLLAQDETGYGNLLKLSSAAYLQSEPGDPPHVDFRRLSAHSEGLICLSGGLDGLLGQLLLDGQVKAAHELATRLSSTFPGRFYIELQRHGSADEARAEPALVDIAYQLDVPLVATNDAFFATRDMHEAHDALLCIDQSVAIAEENRRRVTPEHYFKSAEEMRALFADLPEAIDNTLVIARRCAYRAPFRAPILPGFAAADEQRDEAVILREMALAGLEDRLQKRGIAGDDAETKPYFERLDFELDVIIEMGFAGYFLIVADFIQWAKRANIPVGPGRGSGAGSVVAWVLKITDLDPLHFGLLFERFLNPDRVSMPDFDIDFCQDKRDQVIRYVQDRYGHDQVAQIITFGKLQARAVLRDVGRVLGMPYGQVDKLCKLVPNNPAKPVTLGQAVAGETRLQLARDEDPVVARLLDIALKLEGLYRHASTHAAGVVIGDRPLEELIPLYRDPRSDMPVTQFSMKWVESAGLVKFDLLGLKTLTVLDHTLALLRERGVEIDLETLPLDDAPTYAMLRRAESVGVFQFEGSGMRDLLRESEPSNIEDLIALVALFRPGPMENIPKYIACKHGREEPEVLHETIEPVVKDTYGVIIYQEQVMQIAQVFAGYTLGQADLLRRAMGKKIKSEMDAQRDIFVQGAVERGVARDRAAYVFELVDKFAGYGFNKAHSAAYALVAYQTAYLKANYRLEFLAASMTLDMGNSDKLGIFRQELARQEIALRGPDINYSDACFIVERDAETPEETGAIRYALAAIKNVGREAMRDIVAERKESGPYRDIWDFASRVDPRQINKRQLENLVKAGAFDRFNPNRAQLLEGVDLILRYAQHAAHERASAQVNLFGNGAGDERAATPLLPARGEWSVPERLAQEFDAIGFYLSAHPLDAHSALLRRTKVVTYAELQERAAQGGSYFRIAGTVMGRQERNSARGNRFAFVQFSDTTGMFEAMVFSEQLSSSRELLEAGTSLLLEVEVRSEGDQHRLTVQKISPIEKLADQAAGDIFVFLNDPAPLPSLRQLLQQQGRGRSSVHLLLNLAPDNQEVEIVLSENYAITHAVRGAIKAVNGVLDVHDG